MSSPSLREVATGHILDLYFYIPFDDRTACLAYTLVWYGIWFQNRLIVSPRRTPAGDGQAQSDRREFAKNPALFVGLFC